jgi:hypothetical protein
LEKTDVVPMNDWETKCTCRGSEAVKAIYRRHSKVARIDIPLYIGATGARLETRREGDGFLLRFTGPTDASWAPRFLSYDEHLGSDMTLRDTAEWIEGTMKGTGYRARRFKSGDKSTAAWMISLEPGPGSPS